MATQHVVEARRDEGAILNDEAAVHDGMSWRSRSTAQPRFNRIRNRSRKRRSVKGPHREISRRARAQLTDLASASETRRSTARRDFERHARGARRGAVSQLCEQHRLARLEPQRCRIG